MIEIVDLKGGRGIVVEVKDNAQMRSYALGAMLEFRDLDVEIVRSTIVQPRAPHPDGRIRSEEIHVSALVDWTAWLLTRMRRSKAALDAFPGIKNSVLFEEWAETWLKPGACTFCPAQGFCPAFRKQALRAAGEKAAAWFENPLAPVSELKPNQPQAASLAELEHMLDGLEAIEEWIKAVRSHAHLRAERGDKFEDWMLVDKIGNRTWISKDENILYGDLLHRLRLSKEQIYETPEIKSPAQIEKVLGKRKAELAKLEGVLWHKPVKGTNLVRKDQTMREPAQTKAELMFEQPTEKQ